MDLVKINKAQPVAKGFPVDGKTIVIDEEIPEFDSLFEQDGFCENQASRLETALYRSLPGSTYDWLVAKMLERKASHFRVSHDREEAK